MNRRQFLHTGTLLGVASTFPSTSAAADQLQTTEITSIEHAEHYTWGGRDGTDCDAWYLVKAPDLSIIEERMPSGTGETPHLHRKARQFFFVLEGELTIVVDQHPFVVRPGQGLEVAPGKTHQAMNKGKIATRMVVTSQPPSHGDRIEA